MYIKYQNGGNYFNTNVVPSTDNLRVAPPIRKISHAEAQINLSRIRRRIREEELAELRGDPEDNQAISDWYNRKKPTLVPTPFKEQMYNFGKAIENFYEIPKIGIVNDFINPLHTASSMIIAPIATAPYESQKLKMYADEAYSPGIKRTVIPWIPYAGAAASVGFAPGIMKWGPKTALKYAPKMINKAREEINYARKFYK